MRFAAVRDRRGSLFRFAPLDGLSAAHELGDAVRRSLPEGVAVLTPQGDLKVRSDAVVYLLRSLGGAWGSLGTILSLVPLPLREVLYALVARSRRRLFAPPAGPCPVVPEELRGRFAP